MLIYQTEGHFENPLFRKMYALSVGFKMKPLRKSVSQSQTKPNLNFDRKLAERSNHSLLLSN